MYLLQHRADWSQTDQKSTGFLREWYSPQNQWAWSIKSLWWFELYYKLWFLIFHEHKCWRLQSGGEMTPHTHFKCGQRRGKQEKSLPEERIRLIKELPSPRVVVSKVWPGEFHNSRCVIALYRSFFFWEGALIVMILSSFHHCTLDRTDN